MKVIKSKNLRRVFVRTPSGKSRLHLRKKTGSVPVCPVTGQKLNGIKKARSAESARVAKSKKRVARPFGGMLSSWAARREIIKRIR